MKAIDYKYFKDDKSGQVVKIDPDGVLFVVQVIGFSDKSYIHSKHKTVFSEWEYPTIVKAYENWAPATYKDYLWKLRDYHGMERHHKQDMRQAWDAHLAKREFKCETL